LSLDVRHAYQLARNSLEASFVSAPQRQSWLDQLDACFTQAVAA